MNQPLLCVYHGNCDDGFGAAWAVRHAHPDTEFYAGAHGGKVPWGLIRGRDVVFVDFCYPASIMKEVIDAAKSVLVLDHHKSTMLDITEWTKKNPDFSSSQWGTARTVIESSKAKFIFDMDRSGAMMAWDHYHAADQFRPLFIDYIQDHDLWTKKLDRINEFSAALRSYPMDFKVWDQFEVWKVFDQLLADGAHILRYKRQLVDSAVKNSFWVEIDVPDKTSVAECYLIKVRGANVVPAIVSEVGEELALRYGGIGLTWVEGRTLWNYQLRSRKVGEVEAPDVSKIAVALGGGGHAQASGFKTLHAVHRKWFPPKEDEDAE